MPSQFLPLPPLPPNKPAFALACLRLTVATIPEIHKAEALLLKQKLFLPSFAEKNLSLATLGDFGEFRRMSFSCLAPVRPGYGMDGGTQQPKILGRLLPKFSIPVNQRD